MKIIFTQVKSGFPVLEISVSFINVFHKHLPPNYLLHSIPRTSLKSMVRSIKDILRT